MILIKQKWYYKKNFYKINCEDKNICHKINKILMEELDKIADTNYWKS